MSEPDAPETIAQTDPKWWAHEAWWCPRDSRIVMCPGPCPDGTPHVLLDPCASCGGSGLVDIEPNPGGGWVAERCPTCNGKAALPPTVRQDQGGDSGDDDSGASRSGNPKIGDHR